MSPGSEDARQVGRSCGLVTAREGMGVRVAFALALAVGVAGCDRIEQEGSHGYIYLNGLRFEVLIDRITGCQYLYAYKGGITIRYHSTGKPMCGAP